MDFDVSRRSFLRGTALSVAQKAVVGGVSAVAATEALAQAGDPLVIGPDAGPLTLKVNGKEREIRVAPNMTLAEALRGPLGLTGTKIGCNRGACSACTVLLDGEPTCSCMMLAVEVGARSVTTIEGLARGEELHPIQIAFIEHDAFQCGFCTPGMVLSSAALLEHTANPTADDIKAAISGHFCRCGSYPHVVGATLAAAQAGKG
jgi:aerobic-type carbon monoxide dehydrogenase small subunit (CoxS/CutS family)